ncbi:hypothetical protein ONZ45_g3441 [Pleurotus djamor]|nr:hypothetical protein ONZ45_g3441 [Pleurotus djamor]
MPLAFNTVSALRVTPIFTPSEPSEPSDTLFIANLPFIAEEDDVRLAFEKYGPIEQVRVSVGHDGRSKGSALITFGSNEAASSAMEASNESPIYIFDRPTRVEFARSRPGRAPAPPSERLYVRDWQGGENELRAIFGDFEDSIDHIYFAKDKETGGRSGNVFVNFTSTEAATEALESVVGSSTPDGITGLNGGKEVEEAVANADHIQEPEVYVTPSTKACLP